MDSEPISNPYQADGDETLLNSLEAQRLAAALAGWQRIMSALLFLAAVLIVGSLMAMTMWAGDNAMQSLQSLLCSGIMVLLCYVLPAVLLWRAAESARQYAQIGGLDSLSGMTHRQLVFWRSMGILVLIAAGLWLLLVVVSILGVALIGSNSSF